MKFETEIMSGEFTKHHIRGLPIAAVIHHFTARDKGHPHCHPFAFESYIISGGYVERAYNLDDNGSWTSELISRSPGSVHRIEAAHIHEIIELPQGECYTLILPEEKIKEAMFWQFDKDGIKSRFWYEKEFR